MTVLERATELTYKLQDEYARIQCEISVLKTGVALGPSGRRWYRTAAEARVDAERWAAAIPEARAELRRLRLDKNGRKDLLAILELVKKTII